MRWWLWPASLIWNAAARLRSTAYRNGLARVKRLPGTVISVGNLTAGGTGKTPMVLLLAERLHAEGKRVGILTRGYRGETSPQGGTPQSDEVAIYRARLKGRAELGVGPNRYENGEILARHGVDFFLLDDGFQHMQLARDVDIVLLDATDPFGGGHLLPAGMLREPASALRRADIVVITRSGHAPAIEAGVSRYSNAQVFYAAPQLDGIIPMNSEKAEDAVDLRRGQSSFVFCGIGNPSAFFADLRQWGIKVVGTQSFKDHHVYSGEELKNLEDRAKAAGADALLCTEKDVFNLRNVTNPVLPILFARISFKVSREAEFMTAVYEAIKKRHAEAKLH